MQSQLGEQPTPPSKSTIATEENLEDWIYKIPGQNYVQYIIDIIKRNVKCEDELIHHIVYTILSKDTDRPLNLAILAPSAEGKTYAITQSRKPFKNDPNVIVVGSMTPKFLAHDYGYTVDKNGHVIDKRIKELHRAMELCGHSKGDKRKRVEAKEQLEILLEDSKRVVDLTGKCLIFLDAPRKELWDTIKPILSHDEEQMSFNYVDTESGIKSIKVIVKGWPACIFASAKDESQWDQWDEIASRFMIVSPNMIEQKYKESNKLIFQKIGLPRSTRQKLIVSDEEIELAERCAEKIKSYLQQWRDGVWMPYGDILAECLPAKRGVDVRANEKIGALLYIIPLLHSNNRLKLHKNNEEMVIASLSDLLQVLKLTRGLTEISAYKKEFYDKYIVPLYEKEKHPLTTDEICKSYKEKTKRQLLPEKLRKTYLPELLKSGIIEEKREELDKRRNYYTPLLIGEDNNIQSIPELLCHFRIFTSTSNCSTKNEREFWLFVAFSSEQEIRKYGSQIWVAGTQGQQISKETFFYEYTHEPLDVDSLNLLGLKGACVPEAHFSIPHFRTLHEGELGRLDQKGSNLASNYGNSTLLGSLSEVLDIPDGFPYVTMSCGPITAMTAPGSIEPIIPSNHEFESQAINTTINSVSGTATIQLSPRPNSFEGKILPVLNRAAGMDLEWSIKDRKKGVYCACFHPVNDQPISLHISDFNNDKIALVTKIIETMESFSLVIGHNIKGHDSDFYQLKRMAVHSLELRDRLDNIPYIDTQKLFEITIVENMLSAMGIDYPSHGLNDIAQAILGKGEGKLHGLTGLDIEDTSASEQIEYYMQDAKLSVQILRQKDWEVLRVLHSITEPTGMSFLSICSSYSSRIISSMLNKNGYSNDITPDMYKGEKIPYEGGFVYKSQIGIHRGVVTVDAKSMYPTIISKFNLSSETINCPHEECRKKGKFPIKVMWLLNDGLMKKKHSPILEWWWRCIKEEGIYVKIQNNLIREKDEYKKQGNIIFEKGRKLLANASYGAFQLEHYEFKDQRIGFIITAYGRMIVTSLVQQAPNYGFEVIAGDTDSLFLKPLPEKETRLKEFIAYAQEEFKASLEIDKEWNILVVEDEKSYFGLTKQGKLVFKKMWGMRSSNTQLQKELMSKLVNKEILELYVKDQEQARKQIINDLRPIFNATGDLQKNQYHFTASKPLGEYDKEGYQHEIYLERTEEGLPCGAGIRYSYYKIVPTKVSDCNGRVRIKKFTTHPERYTLDTEKIKEGLVNCANTILQLFGINVRYDIFSIF